MADIPNIEIPKVDEVRKYPWASMTVFLFGVCAFLLFELVTQKPTKDCEQRFDKSNQELITVLQENAKYFRDKEEDKEVVKKYQDTVSLLKAKISEASKLSKQVVVKSK